MSTRDDVPAGTMRQFWTNFAMGFFAVVIVAAVCLLIGIGWPVSILLGVAAGALVAYTRRRHAPPVR